MFIYLCPQVFDGPKNTVGTPVHLIGQRGGANMPIFHLTLEWLLFGEYIWVVCSVAYRLFPWDVFTLPTFGRWHPEIDNSCSLEPLFASNQRGKKPLTNGTETENRENQLTMLHKLTTNNHNQSREWRERWLPFEKSSGLVGSPPLTRPLLP